MQELAKANRYLELKQQQSQLELEKEEFTRFNEFNGSKSILARKQLLQTWIKTFKQVQEHQTTIETRLRNRVTATDYLSLDPNEHKSIKECLDKATELISDYDSLNGSLEVVNQKIGSKLLVSQSVRNSITNYDT